MERLLTTAEAAEYLQLPIATLRYWRSLGDHGPAGYRIGKHVRYPESAITKWLAERERAEQSR